MLRFLRDGPLGGIKGGMPRHDLVASDAPTYWPKAPGSASARYKRSGVGTMTPEERLARLGLELPAPIRLPPTLQLPFSFVNLRRDRALISGHPKQNADGSIAGPFGQVGRDLTTQEAQHAAHGIGLSILANLKAEIGELTRVEGWLRVFGMVNSAAGYDQQHIVMNGFSDLIIQVFGAEIGRHSRSAVGVSGLPMNFAIEIEAEILVSPA